MTASATNKHCCPDPEELLELFGVSGLRSLAFIGLAKNAGKTTSLNHLLRALRAAGFSRPPALSSIGRDGEEEDVVTGGEKPKIYLQEGSLIATAESSLSRCDALLDLLAATGIGTAFGEIYIARTLSDGYVEIAGPSIASELKELEAQLRAIQPDCLFLVDGALSRRSPAGGGITEAAVLAASCGESSRPEILLDRCRHALNRLRLASPDPESARLLRQAMEDKPGVRAFAMGPERSLHSLEAESLLAREDLLRDFLSPEDQLLFLRGAVTDKLLEALRRVRRKDGLQLVVEDGTRLFAGEREWRLCRQQNVDFLALTPIRVPCLCLNPRLDDGSPVPAQPLLELLRASLDLPVLELGPALD